MENEKNKLIKNYLNNIKIDLIVAAYTQCDSTWRDIDYVPEYNKFYFICSGEGWLKIGDKEFFPEPGQLFLMPACIKQSYSYISNNRFLKYWCHFIAKIGGMNLFDLVKTPYFINIPDKTRLKSLFENLISYYKKNELTSILHVKSALFEIISYYLENCTDSSSLCLAHVKSTEKLNIVMNYIENHLSENISVGKLANMIHLHPNYFIRFFKKHMGVSPINYINKLKLEKAKNLLSFKDTSITEIAEVTGFNDIYHFSKAFKNYTGFSPSEFRKLFRS